MEQTKVNAERSMLEKFFTLKKMVEKLSKELKAVNEEFDKAKIALVEHLQVNAQKRTGKYSDLGSVTLLESKLRANYLKENEEAVFGFLRKIGRDEVIRPSIHKGSLSALVKELVLEGNINKIPEIVRVDREGAEEQRGLITFYIEPSIRVSDKPNE